MYYPAASRRCGPTPAANSTPRPRRRTARRPTDTLTAAQAIARAPWYQPERVFALLEAFYPIPQGKTMRAVPYMPYLQFAPSAWVLPLKFDGGGYRAGGKAMFDSEGNLWVGNNFTIGWQAQDALWQGNASKFDPNGKPLSPITTGFAGGGMQGGTFGAAVDAKDNAWLTSYGSKSITVFDKNGKPLTPPEGINFDGRLGLMQGIIVAPGTATYGRWASRRASCCSSPRATGPRAASSARAARPNPASRSWGRSISPSTSRTASGCPMRLAGTSSAFPPPIRRKVEKFETGSSSSGLNIDSQGNVWVTNRFGNSLTGVALHGRTDGEGAGGGQPRSGS